MAERLTDNEIKKGLECCSQGNLCAGFECPYVGAEDCLKSLTSDVLALINRQQAEINRLKLKMSYMIDPNRIGDRHEMGG